MQCEYWKGNIVEASIFDVLLQVIKKKDYKNLRFPKFKGLGEDKYETSKY